jgi:hypothetical protein
MCKPILAAALAAMVSTSCSHDEHGGAAPMAQSEFCQHYSENECSNVVPACLVPEFDCMAASQLACEAKVQLQASPLRSFDPAEATACLAKVSAVFAVIKQQTAITAADFSSIDTACARVFHGSAKENESCQIQADCDGALICDRGYCGALQQVGPDKACANPGETCPQGYYCGDSSGLPVCTARPGLGEVCTDQIVCLEDLRCEGGVCTDRLPIGVSCQDDNECASNFCEPFERKCGADVRFAPESPACQAYSAGGYTSSGPDASVEENSD